MKIFKDFIRTGILLLLSFCPGTCIAQTKVTVNNSIIKFNITSAADPLAFPVIQFSYERKLNKRLSVAWEFGYQFYQLRDAPIDMTDQYHNGRFTTNSDTSFVSPRGVKANVEFRYYFLRFHKMKNIQFGIYSATNFFYRYNKTDIAIVYLKDSVTPAVDCYWMRKKNPGVMQVFGLQFTYKRLALEFYGGIGYTDRTVSNYNREYNVETDDLVTNRHTGAERSFLSDYNQGTVALSAGVRVGVAF